MADEHDVRDIVQFQPNSHKGPNMSIHCWRSTFGGVNPHEMFRSKMVPLNKSLHNVFEGMFRMTSFELQHVFRSSPKKRKISATDLLVNYFSIWKCIPDSE